MEGARLVLKLGARVRVGTERDQFQYRSSGRCFTQALVYFVQRPGEGGRAPGLRVWRGGMSWRARRARRASRYLCLRSRPGFIWESVTLHTRLCTLHDQLPLPLVDLVRRPEEGGRAPGLRVWRAGTSWTARRPRRASRYP